MTYQEIKSFINTYIVQNGVKSITGAQLNTALNALADYYGFDSVVVTTLPAGSDATANVQGKTLELGIPKGADGVDGRDGVDGADAVNPFKGWFNSLDDLKDSYTASVGDSAYVKDASPDTTWSIYVYDITASSNNYWADSGTDADTSNVQTFASGEEVNETYIDDTHLVNPAENSLPKAADVLQLKAKLDGVTAEETKVQLITSGEGQNVFDGAIPIKDAYDATMYKYYLWNNSATVSIFIHINQNDKHVRFLGRYSSITNVTGYLFLNVPEGTSIASLAVANTMFTNYVVEAHEWPHNGTNDLLELDAEIPSQANYFVTICRSTSIGLTESNFFCYVTNGETAISKEEAEQVVSDEVFYVPQNIAMTYGGQILTSQGVGMLCRKIVDTGNLHTQYLLRNVVAGARFRLVGTRGGNTSRLWCFLDANDIILSVANAGTDLSNSSSIIVAPQNATQLIVNDLNGTGKVFELVKKETNSDVIHDTEVFVPIEIIKYDNSWVGAETGSIKDGTISTRTGYIDVTPYEKLFGSIVFKNAAPAGTANFAFYNSDFEVVSLVGYKIDDRLQDTYAMRYGYIDIPAGSKYVIMTFPNVLEADQVLYGIRKVNDVQECNFEKYSLPKYTSWRSRYSLMKDFGTQPAADGSEGSFCNILTGSYNDLLTAVYEPLRVAFPNYITRTSIGYDSSNTIEMFVYDFQPKYYQQHIYLQSCIHGNEPEAAAALARIMYLISHAFEGGDDDLKFMRENVRFTIIPVVNVWGISQNPKSRNGYADANIQHWGGDDIPQEITNIKTYLTTNDLLSEFSFMMDMHTTTSNTYSNFYGALQRHAKNSRTIFRVNSWLYDNFIPSRGVVHVGGKDLGYRETAPYIFRMYFSNRGIETFTAEFTDYIWDGNNRCTSATQTVAVSMFLNYLIQMMNDFYNSMYDVPDGDYHVTSA